jgi:hypothetical protein
MPTSRSASRLAETKLSWRCVRERTDPRTFCASDMTGQNFGGVRSALAFSSSFLVRMVSRVQNTM